MKISGIKIREGIKIKSVGLSAKERKIMLDATRKAIRIIQYKRKAENCRSISYQIELK